MAERKTCECGKKARMNQEHCLDCAIEKVKVKPGWDRAMTPPTQEEITDMILRERGGKGVVKPAPPVIDLPSEAPVSVDLPFENTGEPHCRRCGKPKSEVKVWIVKREKCQNCLSAECAADDTPKEIWYCACGDRLNPHAKSHQCEECRRKAAQQKYLEKKKAVQAEAPKEKVVSETPRQCAECKRELGKDERVYNGKGPCCRGTGVVPRQSKTKTPKQASPQAGPRSGRGSAPSNEDGPLDSVNNNIIEILKLRFWDHIEESRKIYRTLKTIEELTGTKVDLPEIEP